MPETEKQDTGTQTVPPAASDKPAATTPEKKPYYSPGEVMKKKGCIGCGGMVIAITMIVIGVLMSFAVI